MKRDAVNRDAMAFLQVADQGHKGIILRLGHGLGLVVANKADADAVQIARAALDVGAPNLARPALGRLVCCRRAASSGRMLLARTTISAPAGIKRWSLPSAASFAIRTTPEQDR